MTLDDYKICAMLKHKLFVGKKQVSNCKRVQGFI